MFYTALHTEPLRYTQTVPPATEPLAVSDLHAWGWIETADSDAVAQSCLLQARERCERVAGLQLITATWAVYLDHFPLPWKDGGPGEIVIPRPPLQAISSITYQDFNGVTQTWITPVSGVPQYVYDTASFPGRLRPGYGLPYPVARWITNSVTVTYTAGYGSSGASVPNEILNAIKIAALYLYEHRGQDALDEDFLDRLFSRFHHGYQF